MKVKFTFIVIFIAVLPLIISCSAKRQAGAKSFEPTFGKERTNQRNEVDRSSAVTLVKRPDWLLIGGIDVKNSAGGDLIDTNSKTLRLNGWEFVNDDPVKNHITFTPLSQDKLIYWRGKGSITNEVKRERVLVPLAEDTRSDPEREAYFEKLLKDMGLR